MKATALIAAVAILALSFGGVLYLHGKSCCGDDAPMDAGNHGLGPCFGLCTVAVPVSATTAALVPSGWLVSVPPLKPHPHLADPIEKPPA